MRHAGAWLLLIGAAAARAEPLRFEDCIPRPGEAPEVSVEHAGKTYALRSEACRIEFLSDPERYAQLYEALGELERAGETVPEPGPGSLVPS